jgi:cytochrome P450
VTGDGGQWGRTKDVARDPVTDWATDFDHAHPGHAANAPAIWDELRDRCPVAHTDRYGGMWVPTRGTDVRAIAMDTRRFSNRASFVSNQRPRRDNGPGAMPPISADPPDHTAARQALLRPFAPGTVNEVWEPRTRAHCRELLDGIERQLDGGAPVIDAALMYSQQLPVRVTAEMLGLPLDDGDRFRDWVSRIAEDPGGDIAVPVTELATYLGEKIEQRRRAETMGADLISYLLEQRGDDGGDVTHDSVLGTCLLMFLAGIDTTWSAIGAGLWHLSQYPEDRRRWIDDPDVRPLAIEEILRFYAPVTMARLVNEDTTIGGCPVREDDWVLVMYPSYNRDPEMFERAGEFIIDRARNRHVAFGLGIHRCLGSNLARMELTVAIEEWMARFGDFELADPAGVRWSAGQARGPRTIPVRIHLRSGEAA